VLGDRGRSIAREWLRLDDALLRADWSDSWKASENTLLLGLVKELDTKWGDKRRVFKGGSMEFRAIERKRNEMFLKTDRRTERKVTTDEPIPISVRHCAEPLKSIRANRSAHIIKLSENGLHIQCF
jgi:hypothetical protein